MDETTQQMLGEYEKESGVEFWNHLTIVATGDDMELYEEDGNIKQVQQALKDVLPNLKSLDRDIPVIPIGATTYAKQVDKIVNELPEEKFMCDALKGPYELLEEDSYKIEQDFIRITGELNEIETEINIQTHSVTNLRTEIDGIENELSMKMT